MRDPVRSEIYGNSLPVTMASGPQRRRNVNFPHDNPEFLSNVWDDLSKGVVYSRVGQTKGYILKTPRNKTVRRSTCRKALSLLWPLVLQHSSVHARNNNRQKPLLLSLLRLNNRQPNTKFQPERGEIYGAGHASGLRFFFCQSALPGGEGIRC